MSHSGDAFDAAHGIPGPDEGLKHFGVVELRPARLDWLDLSENQRALFVRDGDSWTHSWIAP
ncbi:hypothetical protein M3I53_21110 [Paraburkholderia sp. CNPSo 3272]|uniref:hypothetical protein n=1 Tax=Paraburkholderia sp. CNPSo 3272 TaxID=2940931 RepID=UPI0020B6E117|nr:hypothetical protein [Paraburkholderia sp. CNPSo 3272]MCP3725594.1 hypothetical protein [Paraburkholderia sp. CNPSo 3272]